ncbi:capsule biosynthesis protein CapG [Streptococcus thermophilus]|nr:capsule biosynthesis protein CapG [Streptococcus thermophilus]MCE2194388.1 capsule biosynthesis protein CapG [Streptococcus thermophilus]MCE2280720.1 capsule biosynthesis protein CapG [Streptococcus thermophilus]
MTKVIDFVVTWVDGNDEKWRLKKAKYDGSINTSKYSMNSEKAYREWGTFKYWFRGVEKFAPWVNKVYLVTDNQKPDWLNIDSDKLVLIDHKDIINNDFLPVFSANPIESNIHRIPGLSEHFVFFNDDMYLTAPVSPDDFFSDEGLPKYNTALAPITTERYGTGHFQMNDMGIITSHFTRKEILKNGQFFSPKQGIKQIVKTLLYSNAKFICGFWESHLPYPLLKSTFELVWEKESDALNKTSSNRFRDPSDTNVWLFKYWQIASGKYAVGDVNLGSIFYLENADNKLWDTIVSKKFRIMCINDGYNIQNEELVRNNFINALNNLLPEKSSFEL